MSLLICQFEYTGLPIGIDQRNIEKYLLQAQGEVAFFYDDDIGEYLSLPCTNGNIGIYGDPIMFNAYSQGVGYSRDIYFNILDFENQNGVIIYDNPLHSNYVWTTIDLYSHRLALISIILDNHTRLAHQAPLLLGSQDQLKSLKNLIESYDNHAPYIIADQRFDPQTVKLIEFSKTFNGTELMELYKQYRDDALKHLGIIRDYVQNKTERQITAEVNMANSESFEMAFTRLTERRKAIDYINKMYNLNIEVDFRKMTYKSELNKNVIGGDQVDSNAEETGPSESDTDPSV